jgi:prepilin-type N-terminal cleavage/methylation domain
MLKKSVRRGFTILEVVLVIAVTGLLLVGMLIGTGSSIARQRYNDSVTGFRDFLQNQYSLVASVQNEESAKHCKVISTGPTPTIQWDATATERGRSDCLIYGKLLEFYPSEVSDPAKTVKVTTIIGAKIALEDIDESGIGGVGGGVGDVEYLDCNGDGVINSEDGGCQVSTGSDLLALQVSDLHRLNKLNPSPDSTDGVEYYQLEWGAQLVRPRNPSGLSDASMANDQPVRGSILIVRGPISGTIRTFTKYDGSLDNLNDILTVDFQRNDRSFCIDSDDLGTLMVAGNTRRSNRRMIHLNANGNNASAVEIVPKDISVDSMGHQWGEKRYKCYDEI